MVCVVTVVGAVVDVIKALLPIDATDVVRVNETVDMTAVDVALVLVDGTEYAKKDLFKAEKNTARLFDFVTRSSS